jgi:hypothetical protein
MSAPYDSLVAISQSRTLLPRLFAIHRLDIPDFDRPGTPASAPQQPALAK